MNRRQSLKLLAGATMLATFPAARGFAQGPAPAAAPPATPAPAASGPFTVPPLGYDFGALEPHIDAQTMQIHHDRHHAAYVNAANQLVTRWPEIATTPIEKMLSDASIVPIDIRTPVRNNVGGHWNHSFFWQLMTPGGAKEPAGTFKSALDGAFGNVDTMKEKMNTFGAGRFGSGWVWLVVSKDKKLDIVSTANQDTPLELNAKPIIGIDVWEHAYYLKYQNRRADYLKAWWNVVNWTKATENFQKVMG